jgi:hypothetical protein
VKWNVEKLILVKCPDKCGNSNCNKLKREMSDFFLKNMALSGKTCVEFALAELHLCWDADLGFRFL